MERWRKASRFYWSLVLGTPGHIWRAADVTGRIALLIAVGLTLFFGVRGDIPIWLLAGIGGTVVLAALLGANYNRYAALEERLDTFEAQLTSVAQQYRGSTHFIVATNRLLHAHAAGLRVLDDLLGSMKSGEGSRPALRTRVDQWETDTDRIVEECCDTAELESYRRPLAPVVLTGEWAQDLFEEVSLRLTRLLVVQVRTRKTMEKWLESVGS